MGNKGPGYWGGIKTPLFPNLKAFMAPVRKIFNPPKRRLPEKFNPGICAPKKRGNCKGPFGKGGKICWGEPRGRCQTLWGGDKLGKPFFRGGLSQKIRNTPRGGFEKKRGALPPPAGGYFHHTRARCDERVPPPKNKGGGGAPLLPAGEKNSLSLSGVCGEMKRGPPAF